MTLEEWTDLEDPLETSEGNKYCRLVTFELAKLGIVKYHRDGYLNTLEDLVESLEKSMDKLGLTN